MSLAKSALESIKLLRLRVLPLALTLLARSRAEAFQEFLAEYLGIRALFQPSTAMGLAGEKRRGKLAQDPNNTAWSKSTDGFGHRILSQQGWKPGDYLGAENAAHGDHYTAANASHIKVLLREDNLGLGAKLGGAGNAETFGLSTLSGIFGRLNGKSEAEVEKQQSSLRDAELRTYQSQKYGHMNFVRGGLLVGDKIEESPDNKLAAKTIDSKGAGVDQLPATKKKKRKVESDALGVDDGKRSEKRRRKADIDTALPEVVEGLIPGEPSESTDKELLKAAKRLRKEKRRAAKQDEPTEVENEKTRLKQEKKARKEERRLRKEQKRLGKAAKSADDDLTSSTTASSNALTTPVVSELPSGTSTPTSGLFAGSRHAVRQRYIMQKRAASMDPKALNEILMIKAIG
ncbi:telomerase inhibitor [Recurvomyces mirabilis]|uniref:PinX1-related protein 1 n=1 Tax=Recurvomyces mirabilis TaxID=574656 RepID=A0AAE0WF72_9PEZI|nr:telomerase inhibitor [Recurvomyces mirabilis]KAK5149807.1 telomerase inhibitor [Recurvomyces mirabilis]